MGAARYHRAFVLPSVPMLPSKKVSDLDLGWIKKYTRQCVASWPSSRYTPFMGGRGGGESFDHHSLNLSVFVRQDLIIRMYLYTGSKEPLYVAEKPTSGGVFLFVI